MQWYNPLEYSYTVRMVHDGIFSNPISQGKYWYMQMPKGEGHTILRMKQVLMADMQLIRITEENKIPKR